MKHFYIALFGTLVVCGACNRSQFSTTTRHSRNGKVLYTNHYPGERYKLSYGKSHKSRIQGKDAVNITQKTEGTEKQAPSEPGITNDHNIRMTNFVGLLASTSKGPVSYSPNITLMDSDNYTENRLNGHLGDVINHSNPDTTRGTTPNKNLTFDPSFAYIIKFKNGKEDTVRIVSQSGDGLYYQLISEPKKTRYAAMAEVDTILTDSAYSFKQEEDRTKVKMTAYEKKGLIHSVIGFIPVVGIPFAIIGIILGARSLHRIRKNLAGIEGKKIALSTVIIGVTALIFNIIITIVIFSAIAASMASSISGCDSGIHF